jgi:hypothetical protein
MLRLGTPVKSSFLRSFALGLTLLWAGRSAIVLAQPFAKGDAHLSVSVAVSPTCTIAVTPGEWSANEAIDVQCRNLPDGHPDPLVIDAAPVISEDSDTSVDSVSMVVINF